jgi:hypothetical protein
VRAPLAVAAGHRQESMVAGARYANHTHPNGTARGLKRPAQAGRARPPAPAAPALPRAARASPPSASGVMLPLQVAALCGISGWHGTQLHDQPVYRVPVGAWVTTDPLGPSYPSPEHDTATAWLTFRDVSSVTPFLTQHPFFRF